MNLDELIELALLEDTGEGDHTSLACIPGNATGKAGLEAREAGIIAGIELAGKIFDKVDSELTFNAHLQDGAVINPGDVAFTIEGSARAILRAERVALNFMQRMSGIATFTNQLAKQLEGLNAKITDTRKTTPGLREIEKWAVRIGGGENHRMGLYDMLLIKDNHIDYAGGIRQAIEAAGNYLDKTGKDLKIEVEVRNMDELRQALEVGGIDRIMLDNFSVAETQQAVKLINGKYETESSGGITAGNIRQYAGCGVDYISVGALTHSVKSLDLALKAVI